MTQYYEILIISMDDGKHISKTYIAFATSQGLLNSEDYEFQITNFNYKVAGLRGHLFESLRSK